MRRTCLPVKTFQRVWMHSKCVTWGLLPCYGINAATMILHRVAGIFEKKSQFLHSQQYLQIKRVSQWAWKSLWIGCVPVFSISSTPFEGHAKLQNIPLISPTACLELRLWCQVSVMAPPVTAAFPGRVAEFTAHFSCCRLFGCANVLIKKARLTSCFCWRYLSRCLLHV